MSHEQPSSHGTPLLQVNHLSKHFLIGKSLLKRNRAQLNAVNDVSFTLQKGKTLGIVGESGCGKSTLGRCLLRLVEPSSGEVLIDGKDLTAMSAKTLTAMRKDIQIIFQDPYASLSPRMTIHDILREPLDTHHIGTVQEREEKIAQIMQEVGLRPQILTRYPHEFSGGQRQRIGIARALVLEPKLIIADEPVSALDVSVQAQVLNLISDLKNKRALSFVFIAHDLAVVQHICDEVAVMYLGHIVEQANSDELYRNPKHPYTQSLLSAIPVPNPHQPSQAIILTGDVPSPINPPSGCAFRTRCRFAQPICAQSLPQLTSKTETPDTHKIACHLVE
ncbi:ABC transporter ATP-binding protein [Celerinatantimonas diazotrophica]|uniref:Peptide/nickel transport system ATP-binding protein/oligopeptide transport system ATP-binding protein n=1 Tax=Celerinatantimonas diazotrophica TaxID=412034 RepID=A0A4R1K4M0_9GAMM|nr:dipeptide ABC transporter ATP-binding protein [Celerinatantimonas diazotrophica]TCK58880.1 peptide/nickel transport system ATP-binding protein/oligopeptide transport system ATP-binding protein [Celerinatantimonas diazotrophica]CAG9297512.1 Vitamin B12 import ATP-binding protein BtuD [Celerinatantimonas diazotrophica]